MRNEWVAAAKRESNRLARVCSDRACRRHPWVRKAKNLATQLRRREMSRVGVAVIRNPGEAPAIESQERPGYRQIYDMFEESGFRCQLTGWELTPETTTLDHKTSSHHGGGESIENLQVVHAKVNAAKGVMDNDEFKALCVAVAKFNES